MFYCAVVIFSYFQIVLSCFKISYCHLMILLCCQIAMLSWCQVASLLCCQIVMLSCCHFVKLSFCQIVILSSCLDVKLSWCHVVKLSCCMLSNCQIVIVMLSCCIVVMLSNFMFNVFRYSKEGRNGYDPTIGSKGN